MTNKRQVLLTGILGAATGYVSYFLGLPPNLQSGILGQLVSICPPDWQPAAAGTTKAIATLATLYATFKAAQSGPQSPPKNDPKD